MDKFLEIYKKQNKLEDAFDKIIEKYEVLYFALKYAIENDVDCICSLNNTADEIYNLMQNLQEEN
ncbi:hypothetical protein IJ843_00640 [bacterium]|nr:hypothetical protein [bacterium]